MTFYKPWPGGGSGAVSARDMNILDAQLSAALDANNGGTYPGMLVCADRALFDQGVYFQHSGVHGYFKKFIMLDYLPATAVSGNWAGSAYGAWTATATGGDVAFRFRLPTGAVLRSYGVVIDPAGGHADLPATMPEISLSVYDTGAGTTPTGFASSAGDGSANLTDYQAIHTIEDATNPNAVLWQADYWGTVRFANEDGADSVSGLKLTGIYITFDPYYLDPFRSAG